MHRSYTKRNLRIIYYTVLLIIIFTLTILVVHKQNKTIVSLDLLQSGALPPVAENILPLSDTKVKVPANVKKGEVFFAIEEEPLATESKVTWNLTNPDNSPFSIHIEVLNESNVRLASSSLIPPGYCMETCHLLKKLPSGETSCTAYIMAYYHSDGSYYGWFTLPLTIHSA